MRSSRSQDDVGSDVGLNFEGMVSGLRNMKKNRVSSNSICQAFKVNKFNYCVLEDENKILQKRGKERAFENYEHFFVQNWTKAEKRNVKFLIKNL